MRILNYLVTLTGAVAGNLTTGVGLLIRRIFGTSQGRVFSLEQSVTTAVFVLMPSSTEPVSINQVVRWVQDYHGFGRREARVEITRLIGTGVLIKHPERKISLRPQD